MLCWLFSIDSEWKGLYERYTMLSIYKLTCKIKNHDFQYHTPWILILWLLMLMLLLLLLLVVVVVVVVVMIQLIVSPSWEINLDILVVKFTRCYLHWFCVGFLSSTYFYYRLSTKSQVAPHYIKLSPFCLYQYQYYYYSSNSINCAVVCCCTFHCFCYFVYNLLHIKTIPICVQCVVLL